MEPVYINKDGAEKVVYLWGYKATRVAENQGGN